MENGKWNKEKLSPPFVNLTLCIYCNYQQNNWSELLPLVKFAYNNTPSATISVSPFFTNKKYYLNITVHPEYNIASF